MGLPYKTVAFYTFGCKLNFAETSHLSRDFIQAGFTKVDFNETADIYIINSCSVTENADDKASKLINKINQRSPSAKIIITGCYAQLKPKKISALSKANLIVGTEKKMNLLKYIIKNEFSSSHKIIHSKVSELTNFQPSYSLNDRTRSFLKIQDGCDYTCSFCTIPLARGKSRNLAIKDVVNDARNIARNGINEIVLTGVNIGDFKHSDNQYFIDLIKSLEQVSGISRYRISSIEPNLLTDEIIEFVSRSNKFLPHFHIPLQSGSNKILKLMRRRYNINLYLDRIKLIKSLMPKSAIGIDIIVGFPSESRDDFQQTYELLDEIDCSYLHVFPYSARNNTDALNISPRISRNIIKKRSMLLQKLSKLKKEQFYNNNVGSSYNVLIEDYNQGIITGFTENYIKVQLKGEIKDLNTILPVKLNEVNNNFVMVGDRLN